MDRDISTFIDTANIPSKACFEEKQAWSDLVRDYPDKWIIFKDSESVNDDRVFLCTVLCICQDEERIHNLKKLLKIHNNIGSMRTTSDYNGLMV